MVAALIDIGRRTGMRLEEICSLKVVDVAADRIRVTQAKTDAGVREVPIHPELAPLMARLCEASRGGFVLAGESADRYGRRSHRLARRFTALKKASGLFGRRFSITCPKFSYCRFYYRQWGEPEVNPPTLQCQVQSQNIVQNVINIPAKL